MNKSLVEWLSYIEGLHPKNIKMGLDRVNVMVEALALKPTFKMIVVAGTNGKGSTSAIIESIYCQAGYQVGCYSSPHILRYNERLRINQIDVQDQSLCDAFTAIEAARVAAEIELTYFEFGTLAAIWCLMQQKIDVAILEVGLGGRLDAVNAFDADCAIVTNIALDHQDYLGDTRELIAFEKAGVFRQGKPAICGDANPPSSLISHANTIGAPLQLINADFSLVRDNGQCHYQVTLQNGEAATYELPKLSLVGDFQLDNAACALTAISALQEALPVKQSALASGFKAVSVSGRFELVEIKADHLASKRYIIFDVAHNPHAAYGLSNNLQTIAQQKGTQVGKVIAVFSMLGDKDIAGVVDALKDDVDEWHVGMIDHPRAASIAQMQTVLGTLVGHKEVNTYPSIDAAFSSVINQPVDYKAELENDKIVVFGSFFTVASVKQYLNKVTP
jgi:dihydrofolate synthase/folylpolyglutamate synthase